MVDFLSVVIVSAITSFLVTVMLLRAYSDRLTEMLDTFFNKELEAREEMRKKWIELLTKRG